jgi:1-acyl-sn-glycerol-3-phosphate acyltransferase
MMPREWILSRESRLACEGLVRAFRAELRGAANVPRTGRALVVGNHAFLGIDAPPLGALLLLETGRVPRWLADRNLFRIPLVRRLLWAGGAVPGERSRAEDLLARDELVCVYPGGIDDSFKLRHERYTLKWGERAGFAHVALRAQAPIVPVVCFGADELFDVVAREPWVGRRLFGSPRYDVPLAVPGRKVPFVYEVLPSIAPPSVYADEEAAARALRDATRLAMETALEARCAQDGK